jgi:hypothetical protein
MSTTVTVSNVGYDSTTGVIQPSFKVSAQAQLHDFWDSTNKRYNSGVLVTTIDTIAWTVSTGKSGETATITIKPTNYQEDCNDQIIYRPAVNASSSISPAFKHVTAINYGQPDSSAELAPDGTISLIDVLVEINANAFTPIGSLMSIAVTYTSTFTVYSPYSPIGGTDYEIPLAIGNGSAADWGMVTVDPPSAGVYQAQVVQLFSLAWNVLPGDSPIGIMPAFQLSNPPRPGGAVVANYSTPLAQSYGRYLAYHDYYTYIFAVNDGKVDANATSVQATDGELFNLCNFGLTAPDASGTDTVNAILTYYIETHTL